MAAVSAQASQIWRATVAHVRDDTTPWQGKTKRF
eukprot:COSAG01_NODE_38520_length_488_cov_2.460154_2_plen_33_part_01